MVSHAFNQLPLHGLVGLVAHPKYIFTWFATMVAIENMGVARGRG